jgi:hypothetical protein
MLCSLGQYKKLYKELIGEDFIVNDEVIKALGPESDTTCFMIIYDLL